MTRLPVTHPLPLKPSGCAFARPHDICGDGHVGHRGNLDRSGQHAADQEQGFLRRRVQLVRCC